MEKDEIISRLRKQPSPKVVKVLQGIQYVPISTIEKQLDILFTPFGWQVKNFQQIVTVNEVCGSLELWVKNPDSQEWICRIGAGAVQIQMKKESNILDVQSKIPNAMQKMFPSLKSHCLSNAAASLGNIFGRNIGRKDDSIEPFTAMETDYLQQFKDATKGIVSVESIQDKFRALPESFQVDFEFKKVLRERVEFAQKAHQQQLKEATA